ncbi:MAG TPA: hypothetical protein VGG45_02005 [Terracidiphilus sp.]
MKTGLGAIAMKQKRRNRGEKDKGGGIWLIAIAALIFVLILLLRLMVFVAPHGLKPRFITVENAARLKSCPDTRQKATADPSLRLPHDRVAIAGPERAPLRMTKRLFSGCGFWD